MQAQSTVLNVEQFKRRLWRGHFIRCLIEENVASTLNPEGSSTATVLHLSAEVDYDTNTFFNGYEYSYTYPSRSYGDAVGLKSYTFSRDTGEREGQIATLLQEWDEKVPLWMEDDPIVVVIKSVDGKITRLSQTDNRFVDQLIRMQTSIAYEISLGGVQVRQRTDVPKIGGHMGSLLCGVYYGLARLIHELRQEQRDNL